MSESRYRAFLKAVETGSLTKAAGELSYTQSGVSHLIDALEDELGFKVLRREKKKTELTPEGAALLPSVQALIRAADTVDEVAAQINGVQRGHLTIGTFSSVAVQWLPGMLSVFIEKYPGIEVELRNGTYATVEEDLHSHRVDCAFVTLPQEGDLKVQFLAEDPLLAVVPENHPLARRAWVTPEDLEKEDFIIPAEGAGHDIGSVLRQMKTTPHIAFDISDDFAAVGMVRGGLGITLLPSLLIKDMPMDRLAAVPIEGFTRKIGLAAFQRDISPVVKAFFMICEMYVEGKSAIMER